jgi:hypothetical protein
VLFLFSSRQLSLGYNFAFPFNSHIKATVLRLAAAGFIMLPKLVRLKNILYKRVHLYCFDIYIYIYVLFLIKIEENGRILNRRRAGHLPINEASRNQESRI